MGLPFASPLFSPPTQGQWVYVIRRFKGLLGNLSLTDTQQEDGITKHRGVRSCLNSIYWATDSETANSMLVGSWGKGTRVRPPRDIDIMFFLPSEVYHRFEQRSGNKQSQLLQEIRINLLSRYPLTSLRGDGQVVVIPFSTYTVEVVPAFRLQNNQAWICDTNGGGRYKTVDPDAELADFKGHNAAANNDLANLVRMMKQWQRYNNVPIKSFEIERVAVLFLEKWEWRGNGHFYYDWMVRDFFAHLISLANSTVLLPGTYEPVWLGDDWLSRAQIAHRNAVAACMGEREFIVTN